MYHFEFISFVKFKSIDFQENLQSNYATTCYLHKTHVASLEIEQSVYTWK